MNELAIFFYGVIIGLLFGFTFAIALDEIRLWRLVKKLKKEEEEKDE